MALYEITVIIIALITFFILKRYDEKILNKFTVVFVGILLLQYFTQALWLTVGLSKWTYLYQGINWVITLGRTTMVIISMAIIDLGFSKFSEKIKFILYFIPILIMGVIAEAISSARGTIQYHPELLNSFSGIKLIGSVPIEALYYIPVFMLLAVSFAKYWELVLKTKTSKKKKKGRKR